MNTIRPVPNLNGSTREDLARLMMNAAHDLRSSIGAMILALPHPRDYQTGGTFADDRAEAERRIAAVRALADQYELEAIGLIEEAE
jgi:hypothetical protein